MSQRRDKRYRHPILWVEFDGACYQTIHWTRQHWQVPGFGGGLAAGEKIAGRFEIAGAPGTGLFTAHVIAPAEPGRRPLGASLDWLSPHAGLLLETASPGAVMTLWPACFSCDWSLSGLRLTGYIGSAAVAERLTGRIRHPRSQAAGDFIATVQRIDLKRKELGLAFVDLSSEAFSLLESALRKGGASA